MYIYRRSMKNADTGSYLQGMSWHEQLIRHCTKSGRNSDDSQECSRDQWQVCLP